MCQWKIHIQNKNSANAATEELSFSWQNENERKHNTLPVINVSPSFFPPGPQ